MPSKPTSLRRVGGSDTDSDNEDPSWESEELGIEDLTLDDIDLDFS
jgi:hypothetical protein